MVNEIGQNLAILLLKCKLISKKTTYSATKHIHTKNFKLKDLSIKLQFELQN